MKTTLLIAPGREELLRANDLSTFDAIMRVTAIGEALSVHWNRETVALELADAGRMRKFFLKRLFRMQPEHIIGAAMRGRRPMSQPEHEWHNIATLTAAGLACAPRVAMGVRRRLGVPQQAFLLLEEVPAPMTVSDWLGLPGRRAGCGGDVQNDVSHSGGCAPARGAARRRLLVELGALCRRLDEAQLHWLDLHPKHLHARPRQSGRGGSHWEFWAIDVERVRPRGLTRAGLAAATELADLLDPGTHHDKYRAPGDVDFPLFLGALGHEARRHRAATPGELETIAVNYARANVGYSPPPVRRFLAGLARHARRFPDRDGCCTEAAAEHPIVRSNGLMADARCLAMLRSLGCDTLDTMLTFDGGAALDKPGLNGWRRRDRIDARGLGGAGNIYIKRYQRPPWREQLRRVMAGHPWRSTARVERRAIDGLRRIGVGGPQWIACGERMHGPCEEASALVLDEVPGESLERLVARWGRGETAPPAPRLRHAITRQLADAVRRMHAHGYFHRDLYLAHVFLELREGRPAIRLIDLARAIRRRRNRFRWQVKDLAALDYSSPPGVVTRTDRFRFLRQYLRATYRTDAQAMGMGIGTVIRSTRRRRLAGVMNTGPSVHAEWIEAVALRTSRMARHDAKHGRRGHLCGDEVRA